MSTAPTESPSRTGRAAAPALRRLFEAPVAALMCLTIVPVPRWLRPRGATASDDAAALFPLIGLGVGASAGAVRLAGYRALGSGPATALAFLVAVGVTGALHQDALADCADMLGIRGGRARHLEVMGEPSIGVYGILALGLWGLLMYAALEQTTAVDGLLILLTAGAVGRLAAVLHGATIAPAAASDRVGAGFNPTPVAASFALVLTCLIGVSAIGVPRALISVGVCLLVTGISLLLARRECGGRTRDTLGAAAAVTEVAVVVVLSALLTH